ncbi:MAG: ABC transporter substrate-binding protein [Gemmatales bacterium]|nr:ABC transporter substrate-binding protein [Gemmatales bacterium]MDW8175729.1 ABC transporter substrate-binding protein [Gemmatales bacterium]
MPPRIVSLLASATETVYALGMGQFLVGRSHECDYPPEVSALPILTRPRIRVHASSREIDEEVRTLWQSGQPVYWIDEVLLRQLAPTVILTQDHCEVCAVSLADVERAVSSWHLHVPATAAGHQPDADQAPDRPAILALKPHCLADVWHGMLAIGQALGVTERAEHLVARSQQRLEQLRERLVLACTPPTVLCLEWLDPVMNAGNWMPELVYYAGGVSVLDTAGQPSHYLPWQAVLSADPDVIVIACCGWDVERTRREIECLERLPGWWHLRAVRCRRVFVADGNQYFNRPGPRLVESAYLLAEMLYPQQIAAVHRGTAWQPIYE